ncbi:N-acetylmuramoyl-L-alanine amidase [Ideonella sp. A 288]|uniref:N-acetylmuramoyl-L-alanine amidase n=1 Tax=Ideonella sp. A 288 TaxID=1962181 RepID=UPI000B4BC3EF|nr:peptidoglycan recognition family protein [Ideonella sp. A 288]
MTRTSALAALAVAVLALAAGPADARRSGPARRQAIDMVVIHSTGGPTCDARTGRPVWVRAGQLDDNLRQIEAHPTLGIHHMIDRDGTRRASVPEDQLAHHVFKHSGRSIAVELINDGDGIDPFPEAQLASLVDLLRGIVQRHGLQREGIRRHSDLDHGVLPCDRAQRRKVDPGEAYPHEAVLDRVFTAPGLTPAGAGPRIADSPPAPKAPN